MKRKILCVTFAILLLSLCSCGSIEDKEASTEEVAVEKENQEAEEVKEEVKSEVITQTNDLKSSNGELTPVESISVDDVENIEKTEEESEKQSEENLEITLNSMDGKVTLDDFRVIVRGTPVTVGTDINTILDLLGLPDAYTHAKSCIDEGEEKGYTYGGYVLNTYPVGEKDIIYLIEFRDEAVTDANIGIGSSALDVEAAYGTDCTNMGQFIVYETQEYASLSLQYTDGIVTYLDMYYRE